MDPLPTVASEVLNKLHLHENGKNNVNGDVNNANKEMTTVDAEVTNPFIGGTLEICCLTYNTFISRIYNPIEEFHDQ